MKYYLTTWSWTDISGEKYTVDSVEAGCHEEVLRFTPDILIADTRQFIFPMGTIRNSPATDSLFFTFGLGEDFTCIDEADPDTPSGVTKQSPLWNPQTSSLETIRLVLQRNLSAEDFDTVGVSVLVLVVVEETDWLAETVGVFVSVDDDVIETVDELVFDTVVKEVSVEELDSAEVCVIEVLEVSE